jgi:adenosylhomocysteine nucleosidase
MAAENRELIVGKAQPAESAGRFDRAGVDVLYTGVGKVNAAIALTRRLVHARRGDGTPPLVVNFGTAGSHRVAARSLVACRRFVDRDMDVAALGYPPGETPFDRLPPVLEFPPVFDGLAEAICGSGDSFATKPHGVACEVVDMEAYALAKACRIAGADFACAKYVTDSADENAAAHWKENVAGAADHFVELYRGLLSRPGASLA